MAQMDCSRPVTKLELIQGVCCAGSVFDDDDAAEGTGRQTLHVNAGWRFAGADEALPDHFPTCMWLGPGDNLTRQNPHKACDPFLQSKAPNEEIVIRCQCYPCSASTIKELEVSMHSPATSGAYSPEMQQGGKDLQAQWFGTALLTKRGKQGAS